MAPIYLGDVAFDNLAPEGTQPLRGAFVGSNEIIPIPLGPMLSVIQYAGDGTTNRIFNTGHKSGFISGFPSSSTLSTPQNPIPVRTFNSDGTYSQERDVWSIESGNDYSTVKNYVASFGPGNFTGFPSLSGISSYLNLSDYDQNTIASWRFDQERDVTDGAMSSKVYNDVGAGFQQLVYTGDGVSYSTVGHGCGATPSLVFIRRLDTGTSPIFFGPILETAIGTAPANGYYGFGTSGQVYDSLAAPTAYSSTTFTFGLANNFNLNGILYHAQLFYDVAGVCTSGTVNAAGGSTHSVNLGFEPAYIITINPASGGNLRWLFQNNGATGNAVEYWWHGTADGDFGTNYGNSAFQMTATGFDIPDGEEGNDGTSTIAYVAYYKE